LRLGLTNSFPSRIVGISHPQFVPRVQPITSFLISKQLTRKLRGWQLSCYGLDDRGSVVRFPAVVGNFSLLHRVQNGSGAHPAS